VSKRLSADVVGRRHRDGSTLPLHECRCEGCGGEWFVHAGPAENAPGFCAYCGAKLGTRRDDDDGVLRNLAGFPIPEGES
jgi:rRNA maturation endonuclease Nob1